MFKRAVWIMAIALQTVGLGIISTQAADEPFGSNLTPVTLAAVAQPTAAAPKRLSLSKRLTSLSIIYPNELVAPAGPYTPYKRIAKCQDVFETCGSDRDCCSHVCCPHNKVCELDHARCR